MNTFVQRVMQGLLLVCGVIMLVWIFDVCLKVIGFDLTSGIALWGGVAQVGTWRYKGWLRVVSWVALTGWFVAVFLVFLSSAQNHAPISHVPVWMQAISPFVYALTPVIVLGGLIWIVPVYWRRK